MRIGVLSHGSKEIKSNRERCCSVQTLGVSKAVTSMAGGCKFPLARFSLSHSQLPYSLLLNLSLHH